ncbi:FUSC family protein [Pseudomonas sp. GCM10022188]|uniref:FUSC family protein n=1 Tax=Pseudomonas TaxID=286 RepID=UPI001E658D8D|nr:FUSC family protein [Pseudomonas oryzagri]MCC6074359.1 FUSC family protein [Pseudomonas oryzagri]
MNLPSWREWLYSGKALLAALLALYIALAIPLDNPYWAMASVYVVSHPLSGATRSKALFRALGTLLGAAAAVAMVPPLVHQPVLLSLAVALWVGTLLFLSLLDRTPRSYIFMLAAYTVPLIAMGQVEHPQTIFAVALARSVEILLGITCAALVNAVLWPSRIAPVLGARMDALLGDARRWIAQGLTLQPSAGAAPRALHTLLADVMALDGLIVQLSYDSASHLPARHAREFRARLAILPPQVDALLDPLRRLQAQLGELPAELTELLERLSAWLQHGDAEDARQLREHSKRLEAWLDDRPPAQALLIAGAMRQLRQLLDLWQDCLHLRASFTDHPGPAPALRYKVRQLVGAPQHFDFGLSAFSAASVGLSVFVACLLWIALGWDYGFSGIFMVAVVGCFFAGQDNPAPFIQTFLMWTLISTAAAGLYLFGVLPFVHDFAMLAIALAVPLLLAGTLTGRPQFNMAVMLFAVQTISALTLQDSYRADFPLFADVALSNVLGLLLALVWARLSKPFGAEWAARRLARATWHDLGELARGARAEDPDRVAARTIDRTSQLLPRLGQVSDPGLALADLTRDLRVCFRLLDLQRSLPAAIRRQVEPPLASLHGYFAACAAARRQLPLPAGLAGQLETGLTALLALPGAPAHKAAEALAGLQLALYPAPATALPASLPTANPAGVPA